MATNRALERGEDQARQWWIAAGHTVHPSGRDERVALIVSTDGLSTAVAEALGEMAITAQADQVRIDPQSGTVARVIALAATQRGREVVIPLFPTATEWRVYARPSPGGQLCELIETVTATGEIAGPDGWVPAATIAAHLADHLA